MTGIEALRDRVAEAQERLAVAGERRQSDLEQLYGLFDSIEARILEQQTRLERQVTEADRQRAEIEAQHREIEAQHREADQQREEIDRQRREIGRQREEIETHRAEIARHGIETARLEQENEQLKAMLDGILRDLQASESDGLDGTIRTLDEKISALLDPAAKAPATGQGMQVDGAEHAHTPEDRAPEDGPGETPEEPPEDAPEKAEAVESNAAEPEPTPDADPEPEPEPERSASSADAVSQARSLAKNRDAEGAASLSRIMGQISDMIQRGDKEDDAAPWRADLEPDTATPAPLTNGRTAAKGGSGKKSKKPIIE